MLGGVTVYLAGGGGSLDLCCYVLCGLWHHMCVSARFPCNRGSLAYTSTVLAIVLVPLSDDEAVERYGWIVGFEVSRFVASKANGIY